MAYRIEYGAGRHRKQSRFFRVLFLGGVMLGLCLCGVYRFWPTGREILDASFRDFRVIGRAAQEAAAKLQDGEPAVQAFRAFCEKLMEGSWLV